MKLLDEAEQRWYCYKDDQIWLGKEQRWEGTVTSNVSPAIFQPVCRVCGRAMTILDKNSQRWYCHEDDEVWLGNEGKFTARDSAEKVSGLSTTRFGLGIVAGFLMLIVLGFIPLILGFIPVGALIAGVIAGLIARGKTRGAEAGWGAGIMGGILTAILASQGVAFGSGASLGAIGVLLSIWSAVFCAIGGLIGGAYTEPWRPTSITGISPETAAKVQRLKRMLDSRLITQEDYDEQRKRLTAS
jgi:hypothetical protein